METHKREIAALYPGVDVHVKKVDAGEERDVQTVVDEALSVYGRLDIMFANAGINLSQKRIHEASGDEFMQVMRVNALGYVLDMSCVLDGVNMLTKTKASS